jgi:hypothetical protein
MDIVVFDQHELSIALGALRAIDPRPSRQQDRFLEVIARLHGTSVDVRALPSPRPEETAVIVTDPHRRERLIQLAVVCTTIRGDVPAAAANRVTELARALDIDERAVRTIGELAAHHETLARIDMTRRVAGRFFAEAWKEERWSGIQKILGALRGTWEDAALAWRFKRLGLLSPGSFGRVYWEHCTERHFPFPGEAGGIPERAVFHDLGHILSGYDTDPDGEIQQAAFQSGFVRRDGFSFLIFGILQFHLGVKITPVAEPEIGYLDVEKVMIALARGASCKVDLSDHWDFWPYMPRPLDEVRDELGVPPLRLAVAA